MEEVKESPAIATIIITLNPDNRDFRIQGNVLVNREATIGMLVEALHRIFNESERPAPIAVAN